MDPKNPQNQPAQKSSWIKDLIDQRYAPQTERIKRSPVGFEFKRDPFDPSSYYNSLGSLRDISRGATNVVQQEVANREEADRQREYDASQAAIQKALGGVDPRFTYDNNGNSGTTQYSGTSRKYKLKGVSSYASGAANYFGSKYGIKTVYGLGPGSVPGSDHPKGRAIDLMINNLKGGKARGTAMANDIIHNYKAWNVKYVIWNRYIWHPGRGWSRYSGPSPHTDHVHVSFNK
jgi:hypothetical protein